MHSEDVSVSICDSSPGEVFLVSAPGNLTLADAVARCTVLGARLATVGQIHLAWRSGLEHCEPGWLADGSVRYLVIKPRPECRSSDPGVHTDSSTELTNGTATFHAYCYKGMISVIYWGVHCQKLVLYLSMRTQPCTTLILYINFI